MIESKVSIIVPCYKVENYLHTCIESILAQSYACWELILVDDGSPDRSGDICDSYANIDNRIRVIRKSNGGQADARNQGLDVATGDFITFLDSDDFWHVDFLSVMMDLQSKYNADIVQCSCVRGNEKVFPLDNVVESITICSGKESIQKDISGVLLWGKVYKVNLLDGIRMPVGMHNEDDYTTWKICYRAETFVYTNRPLVYYTYNNSGQTAIGSRNLDLNYFGAFEEKISVFKADNEKDLLRWAYTKWNKAIVLTYGNETATYVQHKIMLERFCFNMKHLQTYAPLSKRWRLHFYLFSIFPNTVSRITFVIKDIIRDHKFRRYSKN